jgi:hypothetical protein
MIVTYRALLELLDSINFPPFFVFAVVDSELSVEVPELEILPVLVIGAKTSSEGFGIWIPTL